MQSKFLAVAAFILTSTAVLLPRQEPVCGTAGQTFNAVTFFDAVCEPRMARGGSVDFPLSKCVPLKDGFRSLSVTTNDAALLSIIFYEDNDCTQQPQVVEANQKVLVEAGPPHCFNTGETTGSPFPVPIPYTAKGLIAVCSTEA